MIHYGDLTLYDVRCVNVLKLVYYRILVLVNHFITTLLVFHLTMVNYLIYTLRLNNLRN
jgi:hypothetical protein